MAAQSATERRWLLAAALSLVIQGGHIPAAQAHDATPPDRDIRSTLPRLPGAETGDRSADTSTSVTLPWSRVVHQSYRDGNTEIYIANDDGSAELRLTNSPDSDIQPDLNRGATRIAYASRAGDFEIRSMSTEGSDNHPLTDNATDDAAPDWSPDGTRIVFQAYRDGQAEIYVMQADGTFQNRLTADPAYDGQPTWSPDGAKIAFVSDRSGTPLIWVMNADGGGAHAVSQQPYSFDPVWSPDGTKIGYDADSDGNNWQELWVMNADGSNPQMLMNMGTNSDVWAGGWSPDSRFLAYTGINYIYYQGNWYWTTARIGAMDLATRYAVWLNPSDVAVNPDWQSLDTVAPTATLAALNAVSPAPLAVGWSGTDGGPSGIDTFDLQWAGDGGAWGDWMTRSTWSRADFPATGGHVYAFRVRARDRAGNLGGWSAPVSTTIEALPPVSTLTAPQFARAVAQVRISWEAIDPGHSGVATFDVQERLAPNGAWTDLKQNATILETIVAHGTGEIWDYRVRATDAAHNVEAWPSNFSRITFYNWQVAGVIHDNAGVPIGFPQVDLYPAPLGVTTIVPSGAFVGYGDNQAPSYDVDWAKTGYGDVPQTTFATAADASIAIALPPADTIIRDGTFESGALNNADWQSAGTLPSGVSTTSHHTGLVAGWLGADASTMWGSPVTIDSYSSGNQFLWAWRRPSVAIDHAGTEHAVWARGVDSSWNAEVWYSRRDRGGDWSAPVKLSTTGDAGAASIAIDSTNRVHVVWAGQSPAYTMWGPGQGWTTPSPIPLGSTQSIEMAVDGAGVVHVVATVLAPGTTTIVGLDYIRRSGGVWAQTERVASDVDLPAMVVGNDGAVHVLAHHYSETTGKHRIRYFWRGPSGGWAAPIVVSASDAILPDLAIDTAGTLHGVWETQSNLPYYGVDYATKPAGQGWTAEERIRSSFFTSAPRIAARSGRIAVLYTDRVDNAGLNALFYTTRDLGTGWSPPEQMTFQPAAIQDAELVLDDGGSPCVLFQVPDYSPNTTQHLRAVEPERSNTGGSAKILQTVTVSPSLKTPVLSFFYQQRGAAPGTSGLSVRIQTTAGSVALAPLLASSDWTFATYDVSAWAGQTITVTFEVDQTAGATRVSARIDDVALGSTYPDVWVSAPAVVAHRGEEVTYQLTYGNLGAAPATNALVHFELPPGLTFVSADAPPTEASPDLWWDVGQLAGRSGPFTITITAQVGAGVTLPSQLTHTARIETATSQPEDWNDIWQDETAIQYHQIYLPNVRR